MRVALFVTCLVDAMKPEVGAATVEVLRRVGLVSQPGSSPTRCCPAERFAARIPQQSPRARSSA